MCAVNERNVRSGGASPPGARVIHTFGPSVSARCRVLILGTMPGVASLAAGQYYAHPRNQFWDVMGALFGTGRDLPYAQRLARLRTRGVALWDVVAECERPGSLDSDIRHEKPNDIAGLLRDHPRIRALIFNGQPAARLFRRHFPALLPQVRWVVMPSTSPAHATRTAAAKQKAWSKLLSFV